MDIRHDLEIEIENDLFISADDYADRDQILAELNAEEYDEGFPEIDPSEYENDLAIAGWEDWDCYDVSYDGESADFGLFEEF